jgi:hypothetical protein
MSLIVRRLKASACDRGIEEKNSFSFTNGRGAPSTEHANRFPSREREATISGRRQGRILAKTILTGFAGLAFTRHCKGYWGGRRRPLGGASANF